MEILFQWCACYSQYESNDCLYLGADLGSRTFVNVTLRINVSKDHINVLISYLI